MNFDCTYDHIGASLTINGKYKQWSLREACFYTAQQIRDSTNKNLIFLHSGGADSQIISWVFRHMNIPVKRVHIRYFFKGKLVNHYESNNIFEDDVVMYDVDMEEYEKSDDYKFVTDKLPYSAFFAIQSHYPDVDPVNDVCIRAGQTVPIKTHGSKLLFDQSCANILISYMYRSECINFFQANPLIEAAFFVDDFIEKSLPLVPDNDSWERSGGKKALYDHYFPEVSERNIPKSNIGFWDGFRHLHIDWGRGVFRRYDGGVVDGYPYRTFFRDDFKRVQNVVRDNGKIVYNVKWNFDGDARTKPDLSITVT